ncbi:MAG: hypothetical protein R3C26_06980 [Calditrichia bacterium]
MRLSAAICHLSFPLETRLLLVRITYQELLLTLQTAYGVAPPPTTTMLDISWKVQTDSFTVDGSDTTWFVEEDETYSYQITVRNTGTLTATNVLLRDVLPDSVLNAGDTLSFAIGDLAPSASSTISVNPTVVSNLPFAPFPLVNTIIATGDNADPMTQTFADTVFAIEKPFVPITTTLDISWKVQTDSFRVNGTDTTWFAEEDETYSYQITVRNTGTLTATNVLLRDVLPDSVLNAGDTLSFAISDLAPSASEAVTINRRW